MNRTRGCYPGRLIGLIINHHSSSQIRNALLTLKAFLQVQNELYSIFPFPGRVYFSYLHHIKQHQISNKYLISTNYAQVKAPYLTITYLYENSNTHQFSQTFSLPFPLTETISPDLSVAPFFVTGVQLIRTSPLL